MANRWENNGNSDRLLGGSQITADGDCSHDIKRCLLLGRKAMTNPDSILKSRDITLPTKDHLVLCWPFSCFEYFPASGSFLISRLFISGGKSIGASASASVLPMNIKGWFPLGLTRWISLQSKGLSRVFSNTTVQKHQFFGAQLSLCSNSHIHTWLLEKP